MRHDPRGAVGPARRRGARPRRRRRSTTTWARCGACAAWSDELTTLHRMVRVREAEAVPDLTAAILGTAPRPGAPRHRPAEVISPARWALFVVALTQLVLAAPALLLGEDAGATVHVARELGSFDVALAVGLLVAAWQPARAWGLLPVIAALGLVMAGTAVLDVVRGTASGFGEAHHVLDLAGLVAALAGRPRGARRRSAPATAASPPREGWRAPRLAAVLGWRSCWSAWSAAPAAAHAEPGRRSTRPTAPGSTRAPTVVRLTFSEPVSVGLGGVRVLDAEGDAGAGRRRPGRRRGGGGRPPARPARRHLRGELPRHLGRRAPRPRRLGVRGGRRARSTPARSAGWPAARTTGRGRSSARSGAASPTPACSSPPEGRRSSSLVAPRRRRAGGARPRWSAAAAVVGAAGVAGGPPGAGGARHRARAGFAVRRRRARRGGQGRGGPRGGARHRRARGRDALALDRCRRWPSPARRWRPGRSPPTGTRASGRPSALATRRRRRATCGWPRCGAAGSCSCWRTLRARRGEADRADTIGDGRAVLRPRDRDHRARRGDRRRRSRGARSGPSTPSPAPATAGCSSPRSRWSAWVAALGAYNHFRLVPALTRGKAAAGARASCGRRVAARGR